MPAATTLAALPVLLLLASAACTGTRPARDAPAGGPQPPPRPTGASNAVGRAAPTAMASVFRIGCTDPALPRDPATGFLHRSGTVVTAAGVVARCPTEALLVTTPSGDLHRVTRAAIDEDLDLAVLWPAGVVAGASFDIGDDPEIAAGEQVSTWGYPAGLHCDAPLLIVGFLAGEEQPAHDAPQLPPRWILDAMNPASPGGPLLRVRDDTVIGVVSSRPRVLPDDVESALRNPERRAAEQGTGARSYAQLVADLARVGIQRRAHAVRQRELRELLSRQGIEP